MQIAIKRPQQGQKIRLEEHGIVGIITGIIGFNDAFSWQTDKDRIATNKELHARLGSGYMDTYFECDIEIVEVKKDSAVYKKGDKIRVTWDEIQAGEFVY